MKKASTYVHIFFLLKMIPKLKISRKEKPIPEKNYFNYKNFLSLQGNISKLENIGNWQYVKNKRIVNVPRESK